MALTAEGGRLSFLYTKLGPPTAHAKCSSLYEYHTARVFYYTEKLLVTT